MLIPGTGSLELGEHGYLGGRKPQSAILQRMQLVEKSTSSRKVVSSSATLSLTTMVHV